MRLLKRAGALRRAFALLPAAAAGRGGERRAVVGEELRRYAARRGRRSAWQRRRSLGRGEGREAWLNGLRSRGIRAYRSVEKIDGFESGWQDEFRVLVIGSKHGKVPYRLG